MFRCLWINISGKFIATCLKLHDYGKKWTISKDPTVDSLKGQNLGFPLLPYFKSCAPFFKATIAFTIYK